MVKTTLFLLFCVSASLGAQKTFRIAAAGKTIEFREIDRLNIVGNDGTEMTVEGRSQGSADARAAGLRRISASGLVDNTGHGLSVVERDGRLLVEQVGSGGRAVTVTVPNSATVVVEQTTHRGRDLRISDFAGELDVSMMYHKITLDNVSGPTAVSAVHGDVVATYDQAPTEDVRLHSTYANVDVTLPAATAVDLRLNTLHGSMYTDFDIQVEANMEAADTNPQGQLSATINGGGPLLSLTAGHRNLYIRKK